MRLELIGKPLGHSKSPEIHKYLIGEDYRLHVLEEQALDAYFAEKPFDGINVAIPYKSTVMKYLDAIDPAAERIGAVNCIVNRGGRLTGYNTDCMGFICMVQRAGIKLEGKLCAITGFGGASKAAEEGVRRLGGMPLLVRRNIDPPEAKPSESGYFSGTGRLAKVVTYPVLLDRAAEIDVLINATPVGMHPDIDGMIASPAAFPKLCAVIDIVANPMRTRLVWEARRLGIKACGGFSMLVAQAHAADELFTGKKLPEELLESCIDRQIKDLGNIVLIGMPSAGKTAVGSRLAKLLKKKYEDMDGELVRRFRMPIANYFEKYGEAAFRAEEKKLAAELALCESLVIATGGGIIKDPDNMRRLCANGTIVWLDRSPELLKGTPDRPLSPDDESVRRLYKERLSLYKNYADIQIPADGQPDEVCAAVHKALSEYDNTNFAARSSGKDSPLPQL